MANQNPQRPRGDAKPDPDRLEIDKTQTHRTDSRQAEMNRSQGGQAARTPTNDELDPGQRRPGGADKPRAGFPDKPAQGIDAKSDQTGKDPESDPGRGIDDAIAEGVDNAKHGKPLTPDQVNKPQ